jgi:hypothetical protein
MQFKLTTLLAVLLTTTLSVAQIPNYVPTIGLVGWWPFNGNANDESGNGNNGTVNGAMLTSDRNGNFNKAYEFNGLNNNIVIPNSTSLNFSSFTISCWYNSNTVESSVLVKNNESNCTEYSFGISHQASWNNLGPGLYTSHGTLNNCNSTNRFEHYGANNVVLNNQWVNVVFSINQNGLCQTFLNGNLIDSYVADLFYSCNSSNSTFRIGGPAWGTWGWFDGKIDDIGIWNRVLSQQEITDLYNGCQLSINTQPTNQTINVNNNAQFVVSSSDTNATYQWQTDLGLGFQHVSNAGQYSGANTDTLVVSNVTISNNNQQFRCIVNPGSCADTSDIAVLTVNNNVGIMETSPNNLISIFPNPTNDNFTIKGLDQLGNITAMQLKDLNGKTVNVLDPKATQFKISELKSGIYFLTISAEEMQEVIKLVKE